MLSEFQKRKIANLFAVHDLDRDGALDRSDYVEYARRLGYKRGFGPGSPKYDDLLVKFLGFWDMLQQIADENQDRRVTLREWFTLFDRLLSSPDAAEKMGPIGTAVFSMLDRNGDGIVTVDEYRWLFSAGALDGHVAEDSFKRLDTNDDGRLTIKELSARLMEFFTSQDPEAPGTWLFGPVVTEGARQVV